MGLRPRLATAGPFRRHGTLLLPAIPIMKKSSFLSLERRRTAPKKKSFLARAHSTKKKSLCSFLSSLVQDDATTIALPCRRFLQGATGRRHHCPGVVSYADLLAFATPPASWVGSSTPCPPGKACYVPGVRCGGRNSTPHPQSGAAALQHEMRTVWPLPKDEEFQCTGPDWHESC
jgi:hypothetical protein